MLYQCSKSRNSFDACFSCADNLNCLRSKNFNLIYNYTTRNCPCYLIGTIKYSIEEYDHKSSYRMYW